MKLRDKSQSPVGGYYFDDPVLKKPLRVDGTFDSLVRYVQGRYAGAGVPIPENLADIIEDQICSRQPPGKCYYTQGLGDSLSKLIHTGAAAIDKIAGTKLEQKARGCGGCSGRRARLNQLTT